MAGSPAAARRKGAQWEIDLVKGLREAGFDAERLHLNGKDDEGDIVVRHGGRYFTIEAKATKALNASTFIEEVTVESLNFTKHRDLPPATAHPVVFWKRARRPFQQGLAILTIEEYLRLVKCASVGKGDS